MPDDRDDSEYHSDLTVDVVHVTDRAILIRPDGGDDELWLPKSCVTDLPKDLKRGDRNVTLKVVNWWLRKENLDSE